MEAPEVQRAIEAGVSSALELGVQVDDVVVINNSGNYSAASGRVTGVAS